MPRSEDTIGLILFPNAKQLISLITLKPKQTVRTLKLFTVGAFY